jgi:hypothetical protein
MSLQDYLTKYYSVPYVKEEFAAHFLEKFGVDVRFEDDLVLFKYNMLAAKFTFPLVHECRGHIWRNANGVWNRVCNPPAKFFNLSEGNCPLFNKSEFEQNASQLQLFSKEDGSLIDVWWDSVKNDWRASTSGSITPFKVGDYDITFDKLFWGIFGEEKKSILTEIGKDYTFCFELCAVQNRIVTRYASDRVYLLLIRHNQYGTYLVADSYADQLGVARPKSHFLYELGINSAEDLVKWVETNAVDDSDIQYKEGWVVYRSGVPLAKVKTMKYLSLHKIGGGDVGCTRNNIIECYFGGSLDDIYGFLVDSMKLFADQLKEKTIVLNQKVNASIRELKTKEFATQKDYALWVLANVDKQFSSFFFANKEKLMKGEVDPDAFGLWLKINSAKFDGYWKS